MMLIELQVEVKGTWHPLSTIQAYADWGSGTIDTARPLLPNAEWVFSRVARATAYNRGYGSAPYGSSPYGGGLPTLVDPGGYGIDAYGMTPYGGARRYKNVQASIPDAWGAWKFAVKVFDEAGNAQGALQEFTRFLQGENPDPLTAFEYTSYNSGTDKVTFTVAV